MITYPPPLDTNGSVKAECYYVVFKVLKGGGVAHRQNIKLKRLIDSTLSLYIALDIFSEGKRLHLEFCISRSNARACTMRVKGYSCHTSFT